MVDFSRIAVTVIKGQTRQPQILPRRALESLRTLRLHLPDLEIFDLKNAFPSLYSFPSPHSPLYLQLWETVSLTRSACLDFSEPSERLGTSSRAHWTRRRGLVLPFSHPETVPKLHMVYADIPWTLLVPGRYATLISPWRFPEYRSVLHDISVFPYTQLTTLEIAITRPIPVWLVRTLLMECPQLQVGAMAISRFPVPPGDGGGGGDPAEPGGVDGWDLNEACEKAFSKDLLQHALKASGIKGRGATWPLPNLLELSLAFGCLPKKEEMDWTRRRKAEDRRTILPDHELFNPPPFAKDACFPKPPRPRDDGMGATGAGCHPRRWREAIEGFVDRDQEMVLDYALGGFDMPNTALSVTFV